MDYNDLIARLEILEEHVVQIGPRPPHHERVPGSRLDRPPVIQLDLIDLGLGGWPDEPAVHLPQPGLLVVADDGSECQLIF